MPVVILLLLYEKLSGKISQSAQSAYDSRISTATISGYTGDICHRHHFQYDSGSPLNLQHRNTSFPQRTKRPETETEQWTLHSVVVYIALSFTSAFYKTYGVLLR